MHHSGESVAGDHFTTAERGCGRDPVTAVERVWQDMVVHIISLRMQREGI